MDLSLSKLQELVMDRGAWHAASPWGSQSQTWLSDWTELNYISGTEYFTEAAKGWKGMKAKFYPLRHLQTGRGDRYENKWFWDFPGDTVVKNPSSIVGDMGSLPSLGTKIPHTSGQLTPVSVTREACTAQQLSPYSLEPAHCNCSCVATRKAPACCN